VKLTFHHTGLIVESIESLRAHYTHIFGNNCLSEITEISSQQVRVCFVNMGNNTYIELIEPFDQTSSNTKKKKEGGYYHMAYMVDDIEEAVTHLKAIHYKPLRYFNSEAFNGKRCIFLVCSGLPLIELIEA
jgi:methylmalonyl-CoA epimerase